MQKVSLKFLTKSTLDENWESYIFELLGRWVIWKSESLIIYTWTIPFGKNIISWIISITDRWNLEIIKIRLIWKSTKKIVKLWRSKYEYYDSFKSHNLQNGVFQTVYLIAAKYEMAVFKRTWHIYSCNKMAVLFW